MIRNWLYCPECAHSTGKDVLFRADAPPECPHCPGVAMRQDWSHGHPPATDVGSERVFQGLDGTFSSTRQAESAAKRRAESWSSEMQKAGKDISWTVDGVAGDKRGGARDVRRLKGTAFGYGGQGRKTSTGETAA